MPASRRSDASGWTARGAFATLPFVHRSPLAGLAFALAAVLAGCSSAPAPDSAAPPPDSTSPDRRPANAVSSAGDSVGAVPGSADAQFVYRFRQTEPSGSNTFAFRGR